MAFSYSVSDLSSATAATKNRAVMHLKLGDTVSGQGPRWNGANFDNDELDFLLSEASHNVNLALSEAFRILANEWAGVANITIGPRSEQYAGLSALYAARAAEYARLAGRGKFYAGGLSADRRSTVEEDDDRIAPAFSREMDKYP